MRGVQLSLWQVERKSWASLIVSLASVSGSSDPAQLNGLSQLIDYLRR